MNPETAVTMHLYGHFNQVFFAVTEKPWKEPGNETRLDTQNSEFSKVLVDVVLLKFLELCWFLIDMANSTATTSVCDKHTKNM